MPLTIKLIFSVLVYVLGTGSSVDRINAEVSDAAKDAGMIQKKYPRSQPGSSLLPNFDRPSVITAPLASKGKYFLDA